MKPLKYFVVSCFCLLFMSLCASCIEAQEKPYYLSFSVDQDSLRVFAENNMLCPMFIKVKKGNDDNIQLIDLYAKEKKQIFSFLATEMDSTVFLKEYGFSRGMLYGKSSIQRYDTLYNYGLPFLKNKRYKVMQGQNTNFTHKGPFSKYAIDFDMKVGQTICAIREGIVVKVIDKFKKGGKGKKYRDLANLIVIYHKDDTFSQYVHLKHKGTLVKVGDTVKKGQVIGYSGNTGMSTTPHLHFAVYKPTKNGLVSIPYILDSIPTKRYVKGKFAVNN